MKRTAWVIVGNGESIRADREDRGEYVAYRNQATVGTALGQSHNAEHAARRVARYYDDAFVPQAA